jgi:acyl dehydratase
MRFDDVDFGQDLPELAPDVGPEAVRRFAETAGMLHPRFFDAEAARREGLPGAIVPGIMSQGILAALIHRWAPEARIQVLDTTFRAPLLVGSKPVCRGVVTDLDREAHAVEIDLTLTNEAGETRVVGTAKVTLP